MGETVTDNPGGGSAAGFNSYSSPSLEAPAQAARPAVQTSAGASTTIGAYEASSMETARRDNVVVRGSTEDVNPSNPGPTAPHADASMTQAETTASHINPFFGEIYTIELEEIVAKQVKTASYAERVDSENYLQLKSVEKDMAEEKAELIKEQGKVEAIGCFVKAAACGAGVAINGGMALGSARYGGTATGKGAMIQAGGGALNGIGGQDSIFSNTAGGITALHKSSLEADQALLEFSQKFAQETSDRLDQDRKETADAKNQVLQAYNQAVNAQFSFIQKG